jgi:hypothetical protein
MQWGAFPGRSTVFWFCGVSKLWRYGWSVIAPMHWQSPNFFPIIRRFAGPAIRDLQRIRNMRSLGARCMVSVGWSRSNWRAISLAADLSQALAAISP